MMRNECCWTGPRSSDEHHRSTMASTVDEHYGHIGHNKKAPTPRFRRSTPS